MASRLSHSSSAVQSHLHEFSGSSRDLPEEEAELSSSSGALALHAGSQVSGGGANAATSMAYLPQTVVLGELRHEAFEACVLSGPSDSGLVSKWRVKDRVLSTFPSIWFPPSE